MKFSCTKENLNKSLNAVGHITTKQTNLPILQNVLLQARAGQITLFTTNLEIGIRASSRGKIDEDGDFTLPAQLFSNYVNLLPSERVDCVLQDNELKITSDQQQTSIKGESASEFPLFPEVDKTYAYTIDRLAFIEGLRQVIIAAAVDDTRPEIAGIFFHISEMSLILAATDSYRLAEKKLTLLTTVDKEIKVIIPAYSAQELLRILELNDSTQITLAVTEHQLACMANEVEFVSRLVEGNFPEYQQIITTQGNTTVALPVKQLIKAVKGAALFSRNGINDITMLVQPSNNQVEIKATNIQLGDNSILVPATVVGSEVAVTFNYRYLLDGLQHITSSNAKFILADGTSPVGMFPDEQEKYSYIIMPIKQ